MEIKALQSEMKYPAKVSLITKYSDSLMRREEDLISFPRHLTQLLELGIITVKIWSYSLKSPLEPVGEPVSLEKPFKSFSFQKTC